MKHPRTWSWRARSGALCLVLGLFAALTVQYSGAVYSSITGNPTNSVSSGTLTLSTNNPGSTPIFSLSQLEPGDSSTRCLTVTSTSDVPGVVKFYAVGTATPSTSAAGYSLEVTRGTGANTYGSCTGFVPDTTNYIGSGAGVIYSNTFDSLPGDYSVGVPDPAVGGGVETWTNAESHSYRLTMTVLNTSVGENATITGDFWWELRSS
jgi:hypothetical protein